MSDSIELRPLVLARIQDDPNVKIVQIGERVPKALKLWMNRDATFFMLSHFAKAMYDLKNTGEACFSIVLPVQVVRAGEEPILESDHNKVIVPDAVIPDIKGEN